MNEVAQSHTGKLYQTWDQDPVFKEWLTDWTQSHWTCLLQMKILGPHTAEKQGPLDVGPQHFLNLIFHFLTLLPWIILYTLKFGPTISKTQSLDMICPRTPISHVSILPT